MRHDLEVAIAERYRANQGTVIVAGHSKGGAIAREMFLPIRMVVSFSAPRAGDGEFAKWVEHLAGMHRFEYGLDIVPHLPPSLQIRAALSLKCGPTRFLDDFSYVSAGTLQYVNGGAVARGFYVVASAASGGDCQGGAVG